MLNIDNYWSINPMDYSTEDAQTTSLGKRTLVEARPEYVNIYNQGFVGYAWAARMKPVDNRTWAVDLWVNYADHGSAYNGIVGMPSIQLTLSVMQASQEPDDSFTISLDDVIELGGEEKPITSASKPGIVTTLNLLGKLCDTSIARMQGSIIKRFIPDMDFRLYMHGYRVGAELRRYEMFGYIGEWDWVFSLSESLAEISVTRKYEEKLAIRGLKLSLEKDSLQLRDGEYSLPYSVIEDKYAGKIGEPVFPNGVPSVLDQSSEPGKAELSAIFAVLATNLPYHGTKHYLEGDTRVKALDDFELPILDEYRILLHYNG